MSKHIYFVLIWFMLFNINYFAQTNNINGFKGKVKKVIIEETYFKNSGDEQNFIEQPKRLKQQYEFDNDGDVISGQGLYNLKRLPDPITKKDDKGNIIEYKYFDEKKRLSGSKEIKYDADGNTIEEIEYNAKKIMINKFEYKYLKDKVIERIHTEQLHPEDHAGRKNLYLIIRNLYEYDEKGNEVQESSYDINGSIGYIWRYEYDKNNNMIKCTWINPKGIIVRQNIYIYNSENQLIEDDEFNNNMYNSKDELIVGEINNGYGQFQYGIRDLYEYDKVGNWIKKTTYKMEAENNVLKYKPRNIEYRSIIYIE